MGDARRRKIRAALRRADESASTVAVSTGDFAAAVAAFADNVLHGTGDAPNVALGPIVWGDRSRTRHPALVFHGCAVSMPKASCGSVGSGSPRMTAALAERSRAA